MNSTLAVWAVAVLIITLLCGCATQPQRKPWTIKNLSEAIDVEVNR